MIHMTSCDDLWAEVRIRIYFRTTKKEEGWIGAPKFFILLVVELSLSTPCTCTSFQLAHFNIPF